jgi:hypothetical protein
LILKVCRDGRLKQEATRGIGEQAQISRPINLAWSWMALSATCV